MKSLKNVTPSGEQLTIIKRVRPGTEIIRGAAGSGKTTTALLKLKLLILWVLSRRQREESDEPVRALVLTFNRTLRGYIKDLIENNTPPGKIDVTVDTFSHWAMNNLGHPEICNDDHLASLCHRIGKTIGLEPDFLIDEVKYVIGRFLPSQLSDYLNKTRDGRGAAPRVDNAARKIILEEIILPYTKWKESKELQDWNDLALSMLAQTPLNYDIVIIDEGQDFSANQVRAVLHHAVPEAAKCFILDTAQRIYAGGFTWAEVGLIIRPEDSFRLRVNYRNTPEISRLSATLINQVALDEDGTAPQLLPENGNRRPILLKGLFRDQVKWCINYIKNNIDTSKESVAFLNPRGWFTYLEKQLATEGIGYVELTQRREWPQGDINVALSTLHSAKGLDFDHVILIGLSNQNLPEGDFASGDDRFEHACRLLSMAIARARVSVILGYKPGEEPRIVGNLDSSTYDEVVL